MCTATPVKDKNPPKHTKLKSSAVTSSTQMEHNTPEAPPKTPARPNTFPGHPSGANNLSPAHPHVFPMMSQPLQIYTTPQRHIQAPMNVYGYAIPFPTPISSSQISLGHAAAHPQIDNGSQQQDSQTCTSATQESMVRNTLDLPGAPVPLSATNTSDASHSEATLQQHPNGVYCIDQDGNRTSPRRAGKQAKPPLEKEKVQPKVSKAQKVSKPQVSKPKGKGSRSGKNARSVGASDEEIGELTKKDKVAAQIVVPGPRRRWSDEEKVVIVDYMVTPENWARAPLNMKELCLEVPYL